MHLQLLEEGFVCWEGNMAVTPVEDDGGHLLLGTTYLRISWLEKDSNKDFIHSAPTAHIYKEQLCLPCQDCNISKHMAHL